MGPLAAASGISFYNLWGSLSTHQATRIEGGLHEAGDRQIHRLPSIRAQRFARNARRLPRRSYAFSRIPYSARRENHAAPPGGPSRGPRICRVAVRPQASKSLGGTEARRVAIILQVLHA